MFRRQVSSGDHEIIYSQEAKPSLEALVRPSVGFPAPGGPPINNTLESIAAKFYALTSEPAQGCSAVLVVGFALKKGGEDGSR